MKVLKIIGLILVLAIAGYLIVAATSEKEVTIERSIEVNLPVEQVYALAADFNFYKAWNPWSKKDLDAEQTIEGTGKELNDVWAWNGDTIGIGSLTHLEFEENKKIVNKMAFVSPMEAEAMDVWTFEPTENGTKIVWTYKGESPFLMRPLMKGILEEAIGGDYEAGLASFKELAEAAPQTPALEITQAELPAVHYLGMEATCGMDSIGAVMDRLYGKLMAFAGKKGYELTGAPLAITTAWSEEETTFWAAIPVAAGTKGDGGKIVAGDLAPQPAITALHVGSYENLYGAHMAINDYITANKLEMKYPVVEFYLNDPGDTEAKDLQTQIYYPVN